MPFDPNRRQSGYFDAHPPRDQPATRSADSPSEGPADVPEDETPANHDTAL